MVVTVTQTEIDNGIPGDCLRSPFALALRRVTGVPWRVERAICYPDIKGPRPFVTPRQVNRFDEDFDNEKPVKPFSVQVS